MKRESLKVVLAGILTVAALAFGLFSTNVKPSNATFSASPTPSCGTFNYEKTSNFSDSKVTINFSNDNQDSGDNGKGIISVSGNNGWSVTNVELSVEDDTYSGYHVYASGSLNNFNPNPGHEIYSAKVTVTKSCATSQPTNAPTASPTEEAKVYWCHYEPNGNHQTLHLPMSALTNAGHVNANGNPLHAGDHAGECVDPTATATSQSTYSPTATPTQAPVPTDEPCDDEEYECYEPTSTPVATAEPTSTPNGDICANLDGIQLTMPDEYHQAGVNCLKYELGGPPPPSDSTTQVLGASTTSGRVLGASTMAGTGAVEDAIFNSIFTFGSLLTSFGIMKNGKKRA